MVRRASLLQWLPVLAMAGLAGGTYWLLHLNLPNITHQSVRPKTHTPDYFADNFSITTLDDTGQTQYRINATKMIHYEDDDNIDATLPSIRGFTPGKPDVTAFGQRGVIKGDGSVVDLYDNARVLRAPGEGDPAMSAYSEHFKVLVNDDIVKTEKPVKLVRGPSVMTASGMIYNNVTREMRLLGQVRGMIAASDSLPGGSK
ncbi:MAG: LPS export ABC transporter periplasmic protein LptC [Pararobbsia sp.]